MKKVEGYERRNPVYRKKILKDKIKAKKEKRKIIKFWKVTS